MDLINIKELLLLAPVILLALTVHEVCHGWTAEKFGDSTARMLGRITLNPLAHLDPFGTIMMFLVHFGWAKPVPVDPRRMRDPRHDMIWVSLAGPASNIALAAAFGAALRLLIPWAAQGGVLERGSLTALILAVLVLGMEVNLGLGLFNLLPIHPLDGSKVLAGLLPLNQAYAYQRLERHGMAIILGIFLVEQFFHIPIFSIILGKPMAFLMNHFSGQSRFFLHQIVGAALS